MEKPEFSPGFFSLLLILAWADLTLCCCFLICILLHEVGHFLALCIVQVPIYGIRLSFFGAVIHSGTCDAKQELIVAAAGPAMNLLFAVFFHCQATMFCIVNLLLAAINLLPVYPLDGGRILRAILSFFLPLQTIHVVLERINFIVCSLLMFLACWLTCIRQVGLWPIAAVLFLLLRLGNAKEGS